MKTPDAWLRSAKAGHCGVTETDSGDCHAGTRGSFTLSPDMTWHAAVAACMAWCTACTNCNYISVSVDRQDCSWYSSCDVHRLEVDAAVRTGAVGIEAPADADETLPVEWPTSRPLWVAIGVVMAPGMPSADAPRQP